MSPYIGLDDVVSDDTKDWSLEPVSVKPTNLAVINLKVISSYGMNLDKLTTLSVFVQNR